MRSRGSAVDDQKTGRGRGRAGAGGENVEAPGGWRAGHELEAKRTNEKRKTKRGGMDDVNAALKPR